MPEPYDADHNTAKAALLLTLGTLRKLDPDAALDALDAYAPHFVDLRADLNETAKYNHSQEDDDA